MTKIFFLSLTALLVACSSTPPVAVIAPPAELTPQQRMSNILSTYDEAETQIKSAETDLTSFETRVSRLRASASESKNMRAKTAFDSTFARLDRSLKQTRIDLQELKRVNDSGRADYKQQLNQAAADMQQSSDDNQYPNPTP